MSLSTSLHATPGPLPGATPSTPAEPDLLRRERSVLRDVLGLVSERAATETKLEQAQASGDAQADADYHQARRALVEKHARLEHESRAADERRRREVVDTALAGEAQAKAEFAAASRKLAAEFDAAREAAKVEYQRAKGQAAATSEAGQKKAHRDHAESSKPVDELARATDAIRRRLDTLAAAYRRFGLDPDAPEPSREDYARYADPVHELINRLGRIEPRLQLLEGLIIPKAVNSVRGAWVVIAVTALLAGLAGLIGGGATSLGAATAAGAALGLLLRSWLVRVSQDQLASRYDPLRQSLADADGLIAYCRAQYDARRKEALERAAARRDADRKRAKEVQAQAIATAEDQRDELLRKLNDVFAWRMTDVQTTQQRDLREAIDAHDRRLAELRAQSESGLAQLDEGYRALKERIRTRYETSWGALADRWRDGLARASAELDAVRREVDGYGPPWDEPAWSERTPPRLIPPVLRFGMVSLDLAAVPHGIAADARLMESVPTTFGFPALRPFPDAANLVIERPRRAGAAALAVLQAAMFRLLTSLPPGRVQFTIVDPIGIGRGFGAFMHLADYDAALVSSQVWTDPRQIDERLAELAAHMEKVTQKYLRNEYATIEAYNAVAGEVAEPYRVLVVADFPSQFDEKSAARLAAIAGGGIACGIVTLLAADTSRPLPAGFVLDDLRPGGAHLAWDGERLAWDDPDFGSFPLVLDPPPPAELATLAIRQVGAAARDARRVEVRFAFVAPPADAWWSADSRAGIDIALGKAGATKRQHLALGHGTSQHVLIAGRTGSGKSTLMHTLITNLALNYSPDEVELYLIDFKKGVEFKVYATHELPHARVVAIESEREFGISVLERLDAELRLRADRFRAAGVQDIEGYRNVPGTPALPRIVLLVDEFQEFFAEEDKLAQEAAQWLDRLVRQGRAFGIHVHLGSQSLSGALSLARSTLGQMAVRIALQCGETDAHLILNENNPAARLLSRPGEAIYNDANGVPEGNHFFQVVRLSDERREEYLKGIRDLARARYPEGARTPIVFEGDAPADLARNSLLVQRLEAPTWPEAPRSALGWLGEAVAIKDPTSALFRRQAGSHLLIVGQNDESALGVTASALVSLAAQFGPAVSDTARSGARFLLLDGTPEDHPQAGLLGRLASALPHGVQVGEGRDAARVVAEVAAEVQRRLQAPGGSPELFLFLHDLARFRDLRRREDDFSFSRRDEDAGAADHLETILREGARDLGVHAVAWCDTVTNLNRYFSPQLLRELSMRVLFQMSPTDSGHLLDSPHASKLGPHRALFASEEQNRLEKFRPYGIPADDWLGPVLERLGKRRAPVHP